MVSSNITSVIISISALFHCLDYFVTVHENRTSTRVITVAFILLIFSTFLFYCYDHWNYFRFVYFYFPRFAFCCFKKKNVKVLKKKSRYCFMIAWILRMGFIFKQPGLSYCSGEPEVHTTHTVQNEGALLAFEVISIA